LRVGKWFVGAGLVPPSWFRHKELGVRLSLFNKKFVDKQVALAPAPDPARVSAFRDWAADIANGKIASHSEVSLHGPFVQKILVEALGYRGPIGNDAFDVTHEQSIIRGSVDVAIGHFSASERKILAPFELKGADTRNLDAIMPGRAKTPVDQAWEYATNNPGSQWVLVSNYLEIRLYSYAEGRQEYESFELARLGEPAEFARAQLLLSAGNLLGGRTAELLAESKRENRDITDRLYADYKVLRADLINEVVRERPEIEPLEAIRTGQKILDRVLFVAFAEDNGLLPAKILDRAFETANPFAPAPVWANFLGLFRAIDKGDPPLQVPRYNGGLFEPDETIDALNVPDRICAGFKLLSEYDFASEVSVTVLGHIFEQSIADVEQLQAEARGEAPPEKKTSGTSGRRKRDGVVYTPDYIARFIVERTLGAHCREAFIALLAEHARKGATPDDDPIKWKSAASEKAFWHAYRDRIAKLRIVDPACGSGVFLVMAFDWLKAELTRCNMRLEALGEGALFEVDSEILTHNLFGVDVNEESVEIAKLSLWIKTARHGKVLDSLDGNFRVGDSLIEDSSFAYRSHGFVWKEQFKEIFAEGGFDIVLGNPPYVRMELLKALKPYLATRFEVVSDRADLYAYFFERGVKLLKPGGRLGYISSSTFFRTGSGAPLRDFLRANATLECVIDFGDHQVFEGVTTYPAIITMKAGAPKAGHELRFWKIDKLPSENFDLAFRTQSGAYPQDALGSGSWELEDAALRQLRHKIRAGKPTLKQVYGSPLYGIKTGLNEAFVVETPTKEQLCRDDPRSAELLKPFLEGKDLKRWRAEPRGLWIIYIPKNRVKIDDYPAIRNWLLPFKSKLEKRATVQQWYELQQGEVASSYDFGLKKICYPEISQGRKFSFAPANFLPNKTVFSLFCEDWFLLSLLNSSVIWDYLGSVCTALRGGEWRLLLQSLYVETIPIPLATPLQKSELGALAQAAQAAAEKRYALQQEVLRRIPDLAAGGQVKLTKRLMEWWNAPSFAAFQAEVKKVLKADIPLRERNEWESWIGENRAEIHRLSAEIARIEREIDAKVYALFDLTPEEIALLEANV
jgi:type I restriction-modification system DNA methylase subunit